MQLPAGRQIVHVDMDAFFAAIEQRDNPALQGRPVIVGADPKGGKGRGVVSTCSYEARRFGVHSAMPISQAYRACPEGIFVRPDMEKYCRISHELFHIFNEFTPDVEMVSVDEAFLDITGSFHLWKTPDALCYALKNTIRERLGLTASVGLAPSKFVAKIASDLKKPDGFVVVTADNVSSFLAPLDVEKIWGVGKKTVPHLHRMGIYTIGELAARTPEELGRALGSSGIHFWHLAQGDDDRPVETTHEPKSFSNEHTFDVDTRDRELVERTLMHLCEQVSFRMREESAAGRTITLKVRYAGFHTVQKAMSLALPTNFTDDIYRESVRLLQACTQSHRAIRLIGVKVSQLDQAGQTAQQDLFANTTREKQEHIHMAIDAIKRRFGFDAISRAKATKGGVHAS